MKMIALWMVSAFFMITSFGQENKQERPNILWIVSEDNTTLLGCYGDKTATTPNIDNFAKQGILFTNAFCTAPVCAPSRSTLITGMYPTTMGTENMRSTYPIPAFIKFFPRYLREAGYYTSNNAKKDYNTIDQVETWDESSKKATYKNRKPGQPFFSVFNMEISHESSLHTYGKNLRHDPESMKIPAYQPATAEMKHDWAQYYDKVEDMDKQVGVYLKELDEAGLAENTIVFYYADNGGVLPRSKRFMYESGLHVPLIIRIPKKYAHLAPNLSQGKTDRIVTFVDFAPTVLSLAGINVPEHLQGQAFLGNKQAKEREYGYSFRGRMDERIDLVRSVRDKKYRYIRNYYPHKIYAQYIDYLWKSPSMKSWDSLYKTGQLNELQSRFFNTKPIEELFDCDKDPDNIDNLAGKSAFKDVLMRMRLANKQWLISTKDAGFIPEARKEALSKSTTIYEYTHSGVYNIEKILETAEMATSKDSKLLSKMIERLKDKDPDIRYWAVTGCTILGKEAAPARKALETLLTDDELAIQLAAAEACYILGERKKSVGVLINALTGNNIMARVQALNILEFAEKKDAALARVGLQTIIAQKRAEYDVRAATKLLRGLPEEE
ncbi:MAG: sulfatase-like hydrolase/transferase [Chitinophagaceae bacterium]